MDQKKLRQELEASDELMWLSNEELALVKTWLREPVSMMRQREWARAEKRPDDKIRRDRLKGLVLFNIELRKSEDKPRKKSEKTHKTTRVTPEPDRRIRPQKISKKKSFCDKARGLSKEFKKQVNAGASMTLAAFCDENAVNFGLAPSTALSKLGSNRDEWDRERKYFRT